MTPTRVLDSSHSPRTPASREKTSLYDRITDRIVQSLEQGVRPWSPPWSVASSPKAFTRPLRANGTPYAGINVLSLWCTALERGYGSATWMTYRQARELGGQVRKGETGTLVVFSSSIATAAGGDHDRGSEGDTDPDARRVRFLKGYTVFNLDQIDGLPGSHGAAPAGSPPADERSPFATPRRTTARPATS